MAIKPINDTEFLSEDEKKVLAKEVQDEVIAEAKAREADAYKAKVRKRLRQRAELEETQEDVFIDLPESALCLRIDGIAYMHNMTYTVGRNKANSMREMMAKSWEHEAEINGKKKNFFVKRRETRLNGTTGGVSTIPV